MKAAAIAFVLGIALVRAGACAMPDANADRAQIASLEQRWLDAIRSGDRHVLDSILADDFIDINTDGRMRGRAEAIALASAPPGTTQMLTQLRIRVREDTAIATGINNVHSKTQGWTVEVAFTDVFERRRGQWCAVSAQETVRKPPQVHAASH